MADRRIEAIAKVMRNGRERHTVEIAEALARDHGIVVSSSVLPSLLRCVPGVVSTGSMYVPRPGGSTNTLTWRLTK